MESFFFVIISGDGRRKRDKKIVRHVLVVFYPDVVDVDGWKEIKSVEKVGCCSFKKWLELREVMLHFSWNSYDHAKHAAQAIHTHYPKRPSLIHTTFNNKNYDNPK